MVYDSPNEKCLLTPNCSRAGAVPATYQTWCPAFFSAPEAQDFGRSALYPWRGLGARLSSQLNDLVKGLH